MPADERGVGHSIHSTLGSLSTEATNVAAAIALFSASRDSGGNNLFADWMRIAARDGAMSIRNFGEALARVRSLIGKVKTWLPLVDTQALKSAEVVFNDKFPFAHKMRHSVAHPEFYDDPTKKMGISGDVEDLGIKGENIGNMVIQGMISDSTFASTFEGVLVKYNLDADTLLVLLSVTHQAFDAFSKPDDHDRRIFPPRK